MPDTFGWTGTRHAQFQGLLSDIRTNPEEVALRLILADWLEEHADLLPDDEAASVVAWSRIIRLQHARLLSRTQPSAEERQILSRYSRLWLEQLTSVGVSIEWHLGLIQLSGHVGDLYHAIRSCDEAIFTRVLWLQPASGGATRARNLDALLALPQLSCLGGLDLSTLTNLGEPVARALARSPHLGGLRHLNARGVGFGATEFAHLANSPYLELDTLDLGYNPAGDDGVLELADSSSLASLRVLRLQRIGLTDAGAEALLESPHLSQLQELSLYGNADLSPEMAALLEERFGLGVTW